MGKYEDTLQDIKETFGIVPGFMKAIPKDVLMQDWPLMKKYQLGESKIPAKYRVCWTCDSSQHQMSLLFANAHRNGRG
jgi:hypothetical protein